MNQSAERHLAKAQTYIGKGEGWYRKAGEEILAAREADSTLSYREIGERFGKGATWAKQLVTWATSGHRGAVFADPANPSKRRSPIAETKTVLAEAPMEQVEQVIASLPPARKRKIAAAAGDEKAKKLEEMRETVERSDFDFEKTTDLGFWPNVDDEARKLIAKLAEIQVWLDKHGDEMIPEPSGTTEPEPARDIMRDILASRKAEIDAAFANVGVGTSIEEGMNRLLRDN